jgi:transcription antitermination factor NusG
MQEWRNLFPGYIFITFDAFDPRWHRVLSTVGVKRMFRDGQGYPLAIPHDALLAAHISAQNETQRILNSIAPLARRQATSQWQANPLRAGEEVRIKDGPFADLLGVVQYSDQVRVHLLISIFGRDSPAHIPLDYIERV